MFKNDIITKEMLINSAYDVLTKHIILVIYLTLREHCKFFSKNTSQINKSS